jgi:hypothetical protein
MTDIPASLADLDDRATPGNLLRRWARSLRCPAFLSTRSRRGFVRRSLA